MPPPAGISGAAAEIYVALEAASSAPPARAELERYREETRASYEAYVERALAGFDGEIKELDIAGVPCRQLTPADWSQRADYCILYAFGGGFISGSSHEDQIIAAPLASRCRARIVMVEYPLSPEHPYPEAQQCMQRIYPVLLDVFGAARLAVVGESAGGNLALALLQHVRDNGLLAPACAALLSPWCDLADGDLDGDDFDPSLGRDWIDAAAEWYAGGAARDDAGVSPLYADMTGLPPTYISTGSRDLLRGMCRRLADRLQGAGVDCRLSERDGMWHVFEFYPIPEADESLQAIADFIDTQTRAAISRLTR